MSTTETRPGPFTEGMYGRFAAAPDTDAQVGDTARMTIGIGARFASDGQAIARGAEGRVVKRNKTWTELALSPERVVAVPTELTEKVVA